MAVYVDKARNKYGRMIMCHMMADSVEELHEMAKKLKLRREWYQPESTPHYDICLRNRKLALELGAKEIERDKVVELIRMYRAGVAK